MPDPDIDFDGVADIADAIEQAGGQVRDFDTEVRTESNPGLGGMLHHLMNGSDVRVYELEVVIPEDTTRDIELDDDLDEDVEDAVRDTVEDMADQAEADVKDQSPADIDVE